METNEHECRSFFDGAYTDLSFSDFIRNLVGFEKNGLTNNKKEQLVNDYFVTNMDQIARIAQNQVVEPLAELQSKTLLSIRAFISSIVFANCENLYRLLNRRNQKKLAEDIFYLIIIIAEKQYNNDKVLRKVFVSSKGPGNNTSDPAATNLAEYTADQIEDLYQEIDSLKNIVKDLIISHKSLTEENARLSSIVNKPNTSNQQIAAFNFGSQNQPPLSSAFANLNKNPTQNWASIAGNGNASKTPSLPINVGNAHAKATNIQTNIGSPNPGRKRASEGSKNNPHTKQKCLHNYDSFDNNSRSKPIEDNDGFKTVLPRNKSRYNNRNSYAKSIGTQEDSEFKIRDRLFPVYIGDIDNSEKFENVENMLRKRLKYNFFELEKLQTTHNRFQSFKFFVKYSDKKLVEDKSIWPIGLIINRYIFKRKYIDLTKENNKSTSQSGSNSIANGPQPNTSELTN